MSEVNLHDLEAITDVIAWVTEQSDTMDVETAIKVGEALRTVARKATEAAAFCEMRARQMLDGQPVKIGDTVYVEKNDGKWRPDQSRIKREIVRRSCSNVDTGEMLDGRTSAERTVDLMYALFVSPKTMPKKTGLDMMGLTNADVADWERTGSHLEAIVQAGDPQ